ncbi:hypothetical protein ACSBR2_023113 [Camellia fascicularis]
MADSLISQMLPVYGEYVSGSVNDEQMKNVVRNSCPRARACGGMYTANTMASAVEAMGMSLPYSSSTPAEDPLKLDECRLAGKYILDLINPFTGKTLSENTKLFPSLSEGQQVIRPLTNPIKETGHIQILYGNLAPKGSVAKITGKEGLYFSGPAFVFEGEEAMLAAICEDPMSFKVW